jgi:hypothetical protein
MILLNDGTYIYDGRTAIDFLYSLGMDNIDIDTFQEYISEDGEEHDIEYWKQEAKEWELHSAHQYELRNALICEIQDLADKLASGKGGTKAQYAAKIKNICEFYG